MITKLQDGTEVRSILLPRTNSVNTWVFEPASPFPASYRTVPDDEDRLDELFLAAAHRTQVLAELDQRGLRRL